MISILYISGSYLILKLTVIQVCIEAFLRQKLFMISLLDNVTVFHNQDQVCILMVEVCVRSQSWFCPSSDCPWLSGYALRFWYLQRRLPHPGSGSYYWQELPGNSEKLFLSLGNITGFFIQNHVIAARLLHDKLCTWAAFAAAITSSSVASSVRNGYFP